MSDKKKNEIDPFLFDYSGDISAGTSLQSDLTEIETMLEDIEEPDLEPREKHLQNIIRKLAEEVRATEGVDAAPTVTPWQGRFDDDGEEPFGAEWKARVKEAEENWKDLFPTRDQEMELLKAEIAKQKPLADKGQAFTDGCKKKGRMDALGRLIKETHDALLEANHKEPSAEDLWSSLPVGPAGSVIQEIEDGVIYWQNDAGAPKETSFKAFQNRLPKIKNS